MSRLMTRGFFIVLIFLTIQSHCAVAGNPTEEIVLWPNGAPGDHGDIGAEHDTTKDNDGLVAGKRVVRLGNVSKPTLTIYRPPADKANGTAVMVCPGGGYSILAMDLEGTEVCDWLNSIGVTAGLLKYRVPARPGQERFAAPLQDAQRAMGILRSRAGDWKVAKDRIGVLGFSAGGHLSALTSTAFVKRSYEPIDAADAISSRPDFTVLIYPAYLTAKNELFKLAPEFYVGTNTPPAFVLQTQDDGVGVENSMAYAAALQAVKVPVELHIYPKGGHGYGLRASTDPVTGWPKRVEEWMRGMGWLEAK